MRVGGALLEVVRGMHYRGGSILRVLESGDIAVGDVWHELPPDPD